MAKPRKMRISFSGTPKEIELKRKRADIQLKILNSKTRAEGDKLQKQLAQVNKKLRALK